MVNSENGHVAGSPGSQSQEWPSGGVCRCGALSRHTAHRQHDNNGAVYRAGGEAQAAAAAAIGYLDRPGVDNKISRPSGRVVQAGNRHRVLRLRSVGVDPPGDRCRSSQLQPTRPNGSVSMQLTIGMSMGRERQHAARHRKAPQVRAAHLQVEERVGIDVCPDSFQLRLPNPQPPS